MKSPHYVRLPEVQKMFGGLSKSTIYQKISEGAFPKPVKLGTRISAWRVSDLELHAAQIDAQVDEQNKFFGGSHEE